MINILGMQVDSLSIKSFSPRSEGRRNNSDRTENTIQWRTVQRCMMGIKVVNCPVSEYNIDIEYGNVKILALIGNAGGLIKKLKKVNFLWYTYRVDDDIWQHPSFCCCFMVIFFNYHKENV